MNINILQTQLCRVMFEAKKSYDIKNIWEQFCEQGHMHKRINII